ncbi:hypothetical protein HNR44_001133 [Geomicrobium halophilum]|uniref:Uncharacterized protein n=1 Tax=Geomicrobium halophilum TaxID=549000 RepID=A0A841PN56_9BACL|nr:hypothetical protein [Geomicrobium halophilum]
MDVRKREETKEQNEKSVPEQKSVIELINDYHG